ncbi:acetyltransferase, GNAT family [Gottschalkia acidurici 9a]|uniref:Acetyltransferase, GNAT family n=1 Tax=Gottschalkia acidurici (strain ATCC 7906 / DSM 604 / BCRC 14475 / CIP 104303 / KCTC 5404 / NCIMB 10678 / 9a) TaxID=1128398 RepID=K0B413_GOTA9|nr:GNAT family N-acetyltransferase [Gottschalkia acidurici]AFS79306.1 acetyltransferase, GNAT family [Gottschalkia acidurici 9a]
MKIEIRSATIQDVETISKIHASSWKVAYKNIVPQKYLDELQSDFWISIFKEWIKNNTLKVKLIYEENICVGSIAYGDSRDESLLKWAEIASLYIHPNYFGKRYGQRLLNVALCDIEKDEYENSYLWVLEENIGAQIFYEKNGFVSNRDKYSVEIMGKKLTNIRYIINLNNRSRNCRKVFRE